MHPAPSIILFTTLSGAGFGLLFWLGLDPDPATGWVAFVFYAIAYALALGGLMASSFHLGRRERALKAFKQWRSSWLSREAWAAVLTLITMGVYGALLVFVGQAPAWIGWLGALLALITVDSTAMIYAQLKAIPRWHHWATPALFLTLSGTGGALLAGRVTYTMIGLVICGALMAWNFRDGDKRLVRSGSTLASATGLGGIGTPRAFEPPHTGTNYLLQEMVHQVGRRHSAKLRVIALGLTVVLPFLFLIPVEYSLPLHHLFALFALVSHLAGVLVSRWLFFAEAEHVVGLYYGKR
jgi:DMSO reductase anchor subunit